MDYRQQIEAWIEAHREEMLEDIKTLCRIDSSMGEAGPVPENPEQKMPFGEGPYRALKAAEKMAAGFGFSVTNYDNYALAADLNGGERQLDILAHLDVVPAQEGWTKTEAFDPLVVPEEGRMYGRGTSDDKGPAVAALYAMRAVKELGIPVTKNARVVLGTNEESGSACIAHYYRKEKEAPMTFSPDGEYPVVNIEKGRLPGKFSAGWDRQRAGARIIRIEGGQIENAVPPRACAVLAGISQMVVDVLAAELSKVNGVRFETKRGGSDLVDEKAAGTDTLLTVTAIGRNAHASTPDQGINALTGLLQLLAELPVEETNAGYTGHEAGAAHAVRSLCWLMPHGETDGTSLGIKTDDEESGPLTLAFSQLSLNETGMKGLFDLRYPPAIEQAELVKMCRQKFEAEGMRFDSAGITAPHKVPADTELVQELNRVYEAYTGLPGGCIAMGGGTYVHDLKNGVAFGACLPGTDTRMHAPDEFVVIDELIVSAKMFAQVIADLCR